MNADTNAKLRTPSPTPAARNTRPRSNIQQLSDLTVRLLAGRRIAAVRPQPPRGTRGRRAFRVGWLMNARHGPPAWGP
jgi:hypothetical protein